MSVRPDLYQNPKLVTVFGGSGFVGRHVVETLTRRGYRVRIAVRHPETAYYMLQIGEVGQTQMLKTNVRIRESVARALADADAAVFLPGLLYASGRNNFRSVHIEGAAHVAELAAAAGIPLVHMSALSAKAAASVPYIASRREGEKAVRSAHPDAVILRPSLVFGPEDNFFNRFAGMARFLPFLAVFGGGRARFQPVYVGDVAEMVARVLDGVVPAGRIYELGGQEILTYRQMMEEMLSIICRRRAVVSIPFWLGILMGYVLGCLGRLPVIPTLATASQIRMLRYDSVVSRVAKREGRTLEGAGIRPQAMAAILDAYLWRFRVHGQFSRLTARG